MRCKENSDEEVGRWQEYDQKKGKDIVLRPEVMAIDTCFSQWSKHYREWDGLKRCQKRSHEQHESFMAGQHSVRIAMIQQDTPSTVFKVQFGKLRAGALYDTGAMLSVMSVSFYEMLKTEPLRRFQRRLVGANGKSLRVHGICTMKMQLGSSLIDQTFVVCDDLEYDVIMGRT